MKNRNKTSVWMGDNKDPRIAIEDINMQSKGKVACNTHNTLTELFIWRYKEYGYEVLWSVFLSNPEYIKIVIK